MDPSTVQGLTIPAGAEAGKSSDLQALAGDPWGYFDQIYCISLKNRADRRESATAEFEKVGLGGRVKFLLVDKHPTNSEQGIFESHQACLRAGLAAGRGPIVVFEDDVKFRGFRPKVLAEAVEFLKSGEPWHAFFFGCYVRSSANTSRRAVRAIRYRSTAHAYVVSREMAENLVALRWDGVAYDDVLKNMDTGQYFVVYPGFAFQSNASTDNDKQLRLDRYRRLFGGMYFGQWWDEFSHRNWRSMIVMHLLTIALLVWVWWLIFRRGR